MFIQQLRDFNVPFRRDDRLARVNVELEQSAHIIDLRTTDGQVKRSVAVVVDRVLIDAVQRTKHLARACVTFNRRAMQCKSVQLFFLKDKKIKVQKQQTFSSEKKIRPKKTDPSSFRSLPVAPQAISVSSASVCPRRGDDALLRRAVSQRHGPSRQGVSPRPRKTAPSIGCQLTNRHEARLKRTDNFKNNHSICAYPFIFLT